MTNSTASAGNLRRIGSGAAVAAVLTAAPFAHATDWDQWRGPGRDGRVAGFAVPTAGASVKPAKKWDVTVGEGHSSPLVVGDAVYVFARDGDDEVARRLSLATGKQAWQDRYPVPYEMNPAARGHGKGPRSTPLYAGGRLYTLGVTGVLSCLDANTGIVVWRKDFRQEHRQTTPEFGAAMSPVIENGLVIAHVGGKDDGELAAFDAKTGAVRWRWAEDGPAYSSPVVATLGGVRQVVTQTQKRCVGLDAVSGKLLWSLPFTTPYDQNSVTPVVVGSDMLVFAGLQQPTFAVKVAKAGDSWTATKAWETRDAMLYMSTPVFSNGRLYGMSSRRQGQMFSLEAATGKVLWTGEGRLGENASIWDVGGSVLALTTGADLIVYRKAADGSLAEAARFPVADGAVWASPAFAGANRLLVKDIDSVALWEFPAAALKQAAKR